jgi:hypothetical protein
LEHNLKHGNNKRLAKCHKFVVLPRFTTFSICLQMI